MWLNEGFATFYQYLIPDLLFPENCYMERFKKEVVDVAMRTDLSSSKIPMNFYAENYEKVSGNFGNMANKKGAAVLRMFQEALGIETFTKGVKYDLHSINFSSATSDDLHRNLKKADDEDFTENRFDIDKAMRTWQDQPGFPFIHVEKNGTKFIFKQERLQEERSIFVRFKGEEIYTIPISYATSSNPNFDDKTAKVWMESKTMEFDLLNDNDWTILNVGLTGYYKVSYSDNIWKVLADKLANDHEKIPKIHRDQLFSDIADNLEKEKISAICGLKSLSLMTDENDFEAWRNAEKIHKFLNRQLFGTFIFPQYQKFIQSLVKPQLSRVGFENVKGETESDREFRLLIMTLCEFS